MRAAPALALAAALVVLGAAPASAYWAAGGAGFGLASAQKLTAGAQPAGSVSGAGSVTVSWAQTLVGTGVLGAIGGAYIVKRYPGAGGAAVTPNAGCAAAITGAAPALSCFESGVPPGFWRYTVTPLLHSWIGPEGGQSSLVPVPPAAPVLDPPAGRNPAAGEIIGNVDLAWSASPGATGYNVYRRAIGGFFDLSSPLNGVVPLTATTWSDAGAGFAGATTYAYVVRAVTGTIQSANSNERAIAPFARPPAPATVTAAPAPLAAISVSWSAVAGATGYEVYRRTPPAAFDYWSPLNGASPVAATAYNDLTSVHGGSYRYVVRSVAAGAEGIPIESFDSAQTPAVTADGIAPNAVTMVDPGSPLRGVVTVAGSASDVGSGVASLRIQHRPSGGATWTDGCVATTVPYSCALATAAVADGLYDMRALAVDGAGNATGSTVFANRRIDNTAPSLTLADPGAHVRGIITLTATAADAGSGLQSVVVQLAPTGSGTWTTVCAAAGSPATCPLNTATLVDGGGYDLRAIATDVAGNASTSALVNRVVDNTAPAGLDIQATNAAGGTAAKPGTGDVITFTFSEPLLASSVLAGWAGTATPVVVRFADGNPDIVTIYNAANTVQLALGSIDIGKKYVDASMRFTGSTAVLSGSTISIKLGAPTGPTQKATGQSRLDWTTSTAATDLAGNPVAGAVVSETGAADLDF